MSSAGFGMLHLQLPSPNFTSRNLSQGDAGIHSPLPQHKRPQVPQSCHKSENGIVYDCGLLMFVDTSFGRL